MKYGYRITWTCKDKTVTTIKVSDCYSQSEAKNECIKSAKAFGWGPKKWYEYWRYGDTDPYKI